MTVSGFMDTFRSRCPPQCIAAVASYSLIEAQRICHGLAARMKRRNSARDESAEFGGQPEALLNGRALQKSVLRHYVILSIRAGPPN